MIRALIWDVDGTLSETEEIHRESFNGAFVAAGLNWSWDQPTYRRLLRVTGGKERITAYAQEIGVPVDSVTVSQIHQDKTARYVNMIERGEASLRPGSREIIQTTSAHGIRQAIATTTSRPNVDALIEAALGQPATAIFDAIAAGDEVARKKPAPDVYLLALARLGLSAGECLAVEDSLPGLASAKAAGLRVILSPSAYTYDGDFSEADWLVPDLTQALPPDLAALLAQV